MKKKLRPRRIPKEPQDIRHKDGREIISSTPMEIPVGYKKPFTLSNNPSFADVQAYYDTQGQVESEEEANDFDIPDAFDKIADSKYQEKYEGQFQEEYNHKQEKIKKVREGLTALRKQREASEKASAERTLQRKKEPKATPDSEDDTED